jgi:hypothetical protein
MHNKGAIFGVKYLFPVKKLLDWGSTGRLAEPNVGNLLFPFVILSRSEESKYDICCIRNL